jgi:hypothetical protein
MINIEISLVNTIYMEEGATLSRTLMPYLNMVTDYRFLTEETHFIASRFLASLGTHIRDTDSAVGTGFILFALHLNPRSLQGIITAPASIASLKEALVIKNFPPAAITVMTIFPDKFLWPDLLHFWDGKSGEVVTLCASLLAKMEVLTDPGAIMSSLTDVLAQRSLFTKRLTEVDRIRLTLPRLVAILEKLSPLQAETITTCLQADSTKWEQLAIQSSSKEEVADSTLTSEEVSSFYENAVAKIEEPISLNAMYNLSHLVRDEVSDYRHSELQSAIAGIIASTE